MAEFKLGFHEIIGAIEAEIKTEYLGGAIAWADKNHNNAWSNAIDRFDRALTNAIDRQDYLAAKIEGDFYKTTVLDLIQKYKKAKGIDDLASLLDEVKTVREPVAL